MALIHSMRLSLMKGAHADLPSTAWQEIGVKPYGACPGVPWGLSGIVALDVPFPVCHAQGKKYPEGHGTSKFSTVPKGPVGRGLKWLRENPTYEPSRGTGQRTPRNLLFPLGGRGNRKVAHREPLSHSSPTARRGRRRKA